MKKMHCLLTRIISYFPRKVHFMMSVTSKEKLHFMEAKSAVSQGGTVRQRSQWLRILYHDS